jgi:hypothetical protein
MRFVTNSRKFIPFKIKAFIVSGYDLALDWCLILMPPVCNGVMRCTDLYGIGNAVEVTGSLFTCCMSARHATSS